MNQHGTHTSYPWTSWWFGCGNWVLRAEWDEAEETESKMFDDCSTCSTSSWCAEHENYQFFSCWTNQILTTEHHIIVVGCRPGNSSEQKDKSWWERIGMGNHACQRIQWGKSYGELKTAVILPSQKWNCQRTKRDFNFDEQFLPLPPPLDHTYQKLRSPTPRRQMTTWTVKENKQPSFRKSLRVIKTITATFDMIYEECVFGKMVDSSRVGPALWSRRIFMITYTSDFSEKLLCRPSGAVQLIGRPACWQGQEGTTDCAKLISYNRQAAFPYCQTFRPNLVWQAFCDY